MKLYKKAEAITATVIIVLIIIIFLGWLVDRGSRECKTNAGCGEGSYCGSDFQCHQMPVIEKTVNTHVHQYTNAGLIIGLAIVIAAIILRWPKQKPRTMQPEQYYDYYKGY